MRTPCISLILLLGVIVVGAEEISRMGIFTTRDPCSCSPRIREVCGTDGLTYRNYCYLDCASRTTIGLRVKYIGACRTEYQRCNCPLIWLPFCGSDGFTYSNICELLCAAKYVPYELKPVSVGICPPETEDDVETTSASNPPEDESGTTLPSSNGTTPEPEEDEEDDTEEDPCENYKKCSKKRCKSEPRAPLCGSNGRTYRNLCQFCCARKKLPGLEIASEGKCPKGKKKKGKKSGRNDDDDIDQESQ